MNTVSSNRRTLLKGLGTIVLALLLVTAMWVPVFADHLMLDENFGIQTEAQDVAGGEALSLLAMSPVEGGVTEYAWAATAGTFSNAAAEDPTWTAPAPAEDETVTLTLTVTVTNSDGQHTGIDTVEIMVRGANPTVSILTADQTVFGGDQIDLQATSADLNTPVDSYMWADDTTPETPEVNRFSNAAAEDPTWTAPATTTATQVVTLTLTVTDINGNMDSDSVTITVLGGPTVSIQTADTNVAGGGSIELQATATSTDSDGTIATYAWTAAPDVGTFSDTTAKDTTWTAPAPTADDQMVTLTLTVTDSGGGGARDSVTITVLSGPTVSIQTADQTVATGAELKLQATADNSGKGFTLAWTATDSDGTAVTGGRFSPNTLVVDPTWTAPDTATNQVVTLTLTATDTDTEADNNNEASDSVTITVRGTDPTVSIDTADQDTADQTVLGGDTTTAFEITVSEDVTTYAWTAVPDVGTFSNADAKDTTWTAPGTRAADQVVTLTLTVTDSDDDTASDSVTITVPSGPTVRIHTRDQTVDGESDVRLRATAGIADGKGIDRQWTAVPAGDAEDAGGTFGDETAANTTWTAPPTMVVTQVVTLTLTVTASDDERVPKAKAIASVTITIPGTGPTVEIGTEDQEVLGRTVLQLEATSADPDGTIDTYLWTADAEDEGMPGEFSDAAVEDPTWTAPATTTANQEVTLTLMVTEGVDSAIASVTITVLGGPTVDIDTADQDVAGGHELDLVATAMSAVTDGTIATYAWTATAGTFSDAAVKDPTWTAPATTAANQVVTLTLTVTDSDDATAIASVTITVRGTDPTVSIQTEDSVVAGGDSIDLQATSADSDGTVATRLWTATAGTFSDAAVEDATWTAPGTRAASRVVTLTLTVTDSDGATASDSVTITVPSGPTVSIQTVDQTVFGGTVVELQATSRDSDGRTFTFDSYTWTADPAGDAGEFSSTTVDDATWTAPAAMTATTQVVTLTLTVTASDDAMTPGSDSVTITILGTDPTVSIQTADQDVAGEDSIELQATSADSDGTIAMYAWTFVRADTGMPGTFSSTTVEDATWTAPATTAANQVFTLTLTVTDNDGGATGSDSVTITVPGTDPTVEIETEDQDVAGGDPIELVAMSADVASHAWTADPAVGTFSPSVAVEDATWTAPVAMAATQVVTLTLTVTDSDGATAIDSVTITILGTDPTVEIETEDQDVAGEDSIELQATSADPDGTIATRLWTAVPAVGTFSDAAVEDATWTAPAATTDDQVVTLTLTVTDSDGVTASDDVTITVPDVTITVPDVSGGPVLASVRVDDGPSHDGTGNDSTGNNDGIAQCEETIELYVSIRNDGELPLTGLSGELIETDPWVRLLYNASSRYPDVAAGSIQENRRDWDLRVSPDAPNGHEFSFTIRLTADEGGPWDVLVTVPIACASPGVPGLASVRVDDGPSHDGTGNDSTGNNDGIAQCEETIELYVSIRNDGELPLTGLSGELIETDPWVRLLYNASSRYPDVAAGSIQENRRDWDLRVSPDAPNGHEFSFTIRLTADEGGPWDVLVTVPIACG